MEMDVTRAVLPHFRSRQEGTIVNLTSGAGPDIEPLIALRTSKSDQEYISVMRNQFMPKAFENRS